MKKKPTKKNPTWFIKVRGSYLPNSGAGWLTYIPYLVYLVGTTVAALHEHYGFITTMLLLVPNWIVAAAVMNWVAERHS